MTTPTHCPQGSPLRSSREVCRVNVDLDAAPCLRCTEGQAIFELQRIVRRADAVARGRR